MSMVIIMIRSESKLLVLDGHSYRNDILWVEKCAENNVKVILNAANTSNFLVPCDQHINKQFGHHMRLLRDSFCRQGRGDSTEVNFNLVCAVYALSNTWTIDVIRSFEVNSLYQFDRDFPARFRNSENEMTESFFVLKQKLSDEIVASLVASVRKRQTDREIFKKIMCILSRN